MLSVSDFSLKSPLEPRECRLSAAIPDQPDRVLAPERRPDGHEPLRLIGVDPVSRAIDRTQHRIREIPPDGRLVRGRHVVRQPPWMSIRAAVKGRVAALVRKSVISACAAAKALTDSAAMVAIPLRRGDQVLQQKSSARHPATADECAPSADRHRHGCGSSPDQRHRSRRARHRSCGV